jgi:hypothetical protein
MYLIEYHGTRQIITQSHTSSLIKSLLVEDKKIISYANKFNVSVP